MACAIALASVVTLICAKNLCLHHRETEIKKQLTISNPSFARLAACSPEVQYIALITNRLDSRVHKERSKRNLTTSSGIHEPLLKLFVSLSLLQDADQGMVLDTQAI
jgi:hypothetical protein